MYVTILALYVCDCQYLKYTYVGTPMSRVPTYVALDGDSTSLVAVWRRIVYNKSMNNSPDINDYVILQLQAGLTVQDISAQLAAAGWPNEAIQAAFAAAGQQLATPTPDVQLPEPVKRGRLKTGWLLLKQSLSVIKQNPGLSRYMIMSMVFSLGLTIILAAVFIFDFLNSQTLITSDVSVDGESSFMPTLAGLVVIIVSGFLGTFVTYYYAAALSSHVLGIFRGTPGDYRSHIGVARTKLPAIASYALIATVVGYLLRLLEERFQWIGLIVSKILGALWTLATSFVLPIIADGNESGPAAIKRSVSLFKANWGETIVSRVSLIGLVTLVYLLISIPLLLIVIISSASVIGVIGIIIVIALFILGIVVLSIVGALAENILNVSLYYYAQYRAIPPAFSPDLLASVFVQKKKKK